jgi:hypothetical protein
MNDNQRKILEMLAEKKISVDEAERLISLVHSPGGTDRPESNGAWGNKALPKYLRVEVRPNPDNKTGPQDIVNIRVPLSLLRAGIKLASVIPPNAYAQVNSALKEKGMDFDMRNIKQEDLEEILAALNDLEVDINSGQQKVHIRAE